VHVFIATSFDKSSWTKGTYKNSNTITCTCKFTPTNYCFLPRKWWSCDWHMFLLPTQNYFHKNMLIWWWIAIWIFFPLGHTMKCHLHEEFVIPCQCDWTTHHLLWHWFQNLPTFYRTATWKVLELKPSSFIMESYEQGGQAYQPLYENMNKHKISNKIK